MKTDTATPPDCNTSFPSEVSKKVTIQAIRLYVNIERKAYFTEPLPMILPINVPTIIAPIIPPYIGSNSKNSKNSNNTSPTIIPINNKFPVFMISHSKKCWVLNQARYRLNLTRYRLKSTDQ